MALVDYVSSSEDESEDRTSHGQLPEASFAGRKELKRKRDLHPADNSELPPLPSKFHDLYASNVRVSTQDDASLHGGRKRITPHVEGNWPSHIYIEWYPSTAEHELLIALITLIQKSANEAGEIKVISLVTSDLGSPLPLHISLSRPIAFSTADKDSFVQSLQRNIVGSGVRPFELKFKSLYWVSNSEKTRWFLALQLHRPEPEINELNRLLTVCNETVEGYSQPPLYTSPRTASQKAWKATARTKGLQQSNLSSQSGNEDALDFSCVFHISIGWALEQPSPYMMDATTATTNEAGFESLKKISIMVDIVKLKVGNVVTSISLSQKLSEGGSMFGV